jgi:hypothetical protein
VPTVVWADEFLPSSAGKDGDVLLVPKFMTWNLVSKATRKRADDLVICCCDSVKTRLLGNEGMSIFPVGGYFPSGNICSGPAGGDRYQDTTDEMHQIQQTISPVDFEARGGFAC